MGFKYQNLKLLFLWGGGFRCFFFFLLSHFRITKNPFNCFPFQKYQKFLTFCLRFMMVLICLIFSVLSTIEQYMDFANETLFWMVSKSRFWQLPSLSCMSLPFQVMASKTSSFYSSVCNNLKLLFPMLCVTCWCYSGCNLYLRTAAGGYILGFRCPSWKMDDFLVKPSWVFYYQ